jgi:hypothetical protein
MSEAETGLDNAPAAHNDSASAEERCPSCDAPIDWQVSRRHRFSPFGAVLLLVLSFWTALSGWLFGFGFTPAIGLLIAAVIIGAATRRAEICEACGYVRPQGR